MRYLILISFLFTFQSIQAFTWPTSTPDQEGISSQGIDQAIQLIQSGDYGEIQSLVIIKNGKLIKQKYFANIGEMAPVYSVTKSIGSTLLGMAKYQGYELDTKQSMMSYMPSYNNINDFENKSQITVTDLLNQRHGLSWDEWTIPYGSPNNPVGAMLQTQDWYRTVLEWPIDHLPNQNFAYSTGASSLMSVILKNISNQTPQQFIQEHLYQPLDITEYHWELIEANGSMGQGISTFPSGLAPLGFGIWLKPIDMAKIGEMIRNGGVWQGQRLLSEDWIQHFKVSNSNGVTDSDIFSDSNTGYGYQWWQHGFKDSIGRTFQSYYANGYGRQYIFIFPEIDMVVVSTARDYNRETRSAEGIGSLLRNYILPGVTSYSQGYYPISKQLNGSWYWPKNSGQGINIEILDNGTRVLAYWYTYDDDGKQRWFVMQGDIIENLAKLTIFSTENGGFVFSEPPDLVEWGTAEIFFQSCYKSFFSFASEVEDVSALLPLSRLTGNCESNQKFQNKQIVP